MTAPDADRSVSKDNDVENLNETSITGQPDGSDLGETMAGGNSGPKEQKVQKRAAKKPAKQSKSASKKVTQLGDFKLMKKLGQGGMGEVYLANQVSLDRKVALKVLSKELAKRKDFVDRFIREARSMAKVDHPNVVQIYAAQEDKGLNFVAIEFIDGKSMQDWMDELGKLSIGDSLHTVLMCAHALKSAHDMTLIHRDIKPDNILVTKKGAVKVADFGLAKAADEDVSMTQSGTGLGTPLYMPPEQARNAKNVDLRTDIYALGVTLYYFMTGELPYTGDNMLELITVKEKGKYAPAKSLNASIPEKLDLILDKMIAQNPDHRYKTCDELIAALEALGLANSALSFIEGAESTLVASQASPASTKQQAKPSQPSGVPLSSADDAERASLSKSGIEEKWFIKHTNVKGKLTISRMTSEQILQGLRGELIDLKAQAKGSMNAQFMPLASFPEFESIMKKRLVKAQTEGRSDYMRDMYKKIDKQERGRKRWKWLIRKGEGFMGLVGLIFYLVVICAVVFGLYYAGKEWLIPWLKDQFGS